MHLKTRRRGNHVTERQRAVRELWRARLMATEWPLGHRGRLAVSLRIELHWRLGFTLKLALERIFMSADSVAESLVETLIRIGDRCTAESSIRDC
jgi:hypothetical protein